MNLNQSKREINKHRVKTRQKVEDAGSNPAQDKF